MRSGRIIPLLSLLVVLACARSTAPGADSTGGGIRFDGSWEPGETFVLARLTSTSAGGDRIQLELVGSHVVVDPDAGKVAVEVAVRNAGDDPLHAPAIVWLRSFQPPEVEPIEADLETPGGDLAAGMAWGYVYDDLLGDDGVLSPGETSGGKTWRFADPDAAPFAFAARADFGTAARAHITGVVFVDENRNGVRDPAEEPLEGGWQATLTSPDGHVREAEPGPGGRYGFAVERPGLYRVELVVFIEPVFCITSPNPLEVLLTPGPGGLPQSYDDAHFGFAFGHCDDPIATVTLTEHDREEIEPQDPYALLELELRGDVLRLDVGFSGCAPDHPFELVASRKLSWPLLDDLRPMVWMVLAHDDRGELCEAAFMRRLAFDLSPLRELHEGEILILFHDAEGQTHDLVFAP